MPSRFSPPSLVSTTPSGSSACEQEKERESPPSASPNSIRKRSSGLGKVSKQERERSSSCPLRWAERVAKVISSPAPPYKRWQKRSGMLKAGSSPAQKGTNNWSCGNKAHLPRKISLVYAKELPDKTGAPPFYDTRQGAQNGKLVNVLDLSNKNVVKRSCGHRANRRRFFCPRRFFPARAPSAGPAQSRQPPRPARPVRR